MIFRSSGVLLHPTSLPSPYGIGDLGPEAYRFADFLHSSRQHFWQILPLTQSDWKTGFSPYTGISAFAGNTLLISPEQLVEQGLLEKRDIHFQNLSNSSLAEYEKAFAWKEEIFERAFQAFRRSGPDSEFERFCRKQKQWLDEYVLFKALKEEFGPEISWREWPKEYRDRHQKALDAAAKTFRRELDRERFLQYLFHRQWMDLKSYCREKQVHIIGDLPIYLNYDSADVWTYPELFKLNRFKVPVSVSGVPPDYFSETGQLWGNPVYDWSRHQQTGFFWWIERLTHNLKLFDLIRVDHFRGFVAAWEVPHGEKTAMNGRWVQAPVWEFLRTLLRSFPSLPIIAEDLGEITPDVREVIAHFQIPGMKVLVFAFGDHNGGNPFLPHQYPENCVVYTGTHDTNTVRGWWAQETTPAIREEVFAYLGRSLAEEDLPWELMRLGMMSVARLMITPVQDLLALPASARMNRPSSTAGNWLWRLLPGQLGSDLAMKLGDMTKLYGRA